MSHGFNGGSSVDTNDGRFLRPQQADFVHQATVSSVDTAKRLSSAAALDANADTKGLWTSAPGDLPLNALPTAPTSNRAPRADRPQLSPWTLQAGQVVQR